MNLILLYPEDYIDSATVRIDDYRQQYVATIHRPQIGASLNVGNIGGQIGTGVVTCLNDTVLELQVSCVVNPPELLPLTLVLAMPRPKVFQRVLLTATTLGVKKIVFINTWRVDKSYWGSPVLSEDKIRQQLVTGLEQAGDTILPLVELRNLFKPFVEDELPDLIGSNPAYVAHPGIAAECPVNMAAYCANDDGNVVIVIGPEGGFIPYEIEKLTAAGCKQVRIGTRILRVETAVTWLAAHI